MSISDDLEVNACNKKGTLQTRNGSNTFLPGLKRVDISNVPVISMLNQSCMY